MLVTEFQKWLLFCIGYAESLLFTGIIYGWPSLVYLFKRDNLFGDLCSNVTVSVMTVKNSTGEIDVKNSQIPHGSCYEEDSMYNLAFSIGVCLLSFSVMSGALILDHLGIFITRIINTLLLSTSFILLGLCNKDRPYLLFCGVVLLGLGGGQLRITDLQIADVFVKTKATVISLYSGAYTGSAIVFLFFKILNEYGVSWNVVFFIWSGLSFLMLIPTFTSFPKKSFLIKEKDKKHKPKDNRTKSENADEKTLLLRSDSKHEKDHHGFDKASVEQMRSLPLTDSLTSFSYIIHVYSISMSCLLVMIYNGSFNLWINRITDNAETVSFLTELFGSVQILMVVISPVIGTMMDYGVNKANNVEDPIERRKKRQKAGFWALTITFVAIIALLTCTLFHTLTAVGISVFVYILCRSMSISCQPAYIRVRFPQHHFNVLTGLSGMAVGFAGLIEYFFFIWIGNDPLAARLTLLVLVSLNFLSPFHLLCLPVRQSYS